MVQAVVLGVVGVVVLFLGTTSLIVAASRRGVVQTRERLQRAVDRRRALARRLGETVRSYIGDEPPVRHLLGPSAERPAAAAPAGGIDTSELQLVGAVSAVVSVATEYPELRGDPVYRDLHDQLEESHRVVVEAADAYRRQALRLNRRRRRVALRPAAALLRTRPAPLFDPGALGGAG